jgi:hypothetical protein
LVKKTIQKGDLGDRYMTVRMQLCVRRWMRINSEDNKERWESQPNNRAKEAADRKLPRGDSRLGVLLQDQPNRILAGDKAGQLRNTE